MKTIERIKDEVAQKYGHTNFRSFKVKCLRMAHQFHDMIPLMEEVAETYAQQQVSIAVEKALTKVKSKLNKIDDGIAGCTYNDTDFDSQSVCYGYNNAIDDVKQSILSLAPQILEELKGGEWK